MDSTDIEEEAQVIDWLADNRSLLTCVGCAAIVLGLWAWACFGKKETWL
jgi:hypothetical protein